MKAIIQIITLIFDLLKGIFDLLFEAGEFIFQASTKKKRIPFLFCLPRDLTFQV